MDKVAKTIKRMQASRAACKGTVTDSVLVCCQWVVKRKGIPYTVTVRVGDGLNPDRAVDDPGPRYGKR